MEINKTVGEYMELQNALQELQDALKEIRLVLTDANTKLEEIIKSL